MLAVRFSVSRRRFYAGTWLSTSVHVESTPSFLPLRTAAFFFFLFSSFFPTSAHTLSNLLSANRLSFMTRPSSFSHPVTVYHSWLVLFLLSSHLHHNLPPLTAGATWRSHVTLECVVLEPCVGAGRKDWKKKTRVGSAETFLSLWLAMKVINVTWAKWTQAWRTRCFEKRKWTTMMMSR